MSDPLDFLDAELSALAEDGLLRTLQPLASPTGPTIRLPGGVRRINVSSNDFLSLAADPRLAAAARRAMEEEGVGAGASRLVTGDLPAHREVERAAAALVGHEDALLFVSGMAANTGAIAALVGREDLVVSDALNHASLVDGARLSRAELAIVPHVDLAAIEQALRRPARRRLVVTDALFSMDGDVAPLRALRALCDEYGAILYVDEAHAVGVLGEGGAGACAAAGVRADVVMGTLGKAFGAGGAFVAGRANLRDFLLNRARSFVFSTGLPPMVAAAAREGMRVAAEEPWRRARALFLGVRVAEAAEARGLHTCGSRTQIVPLVFGAPERALAAAERLQAAGIHARAIRPPTVPHGTSRVRLVLQAGHDDASIDRLLEAIAALPR